MTGSKLWNIIHYVPDKSGLSQEFCSFIFLPTHGAECCYFRDALFGKKISLPEGKVNLILRVYILREMKLVFPWNGPWKILYATEKKKLAFFCAKTLLLDRLAIEN